MGLKKNKAFMLFMFLLIPIGSYASGDLSARIGEIRKLYQNTVFNLKKYKQFKIDLIEVSTEGGEVYFWVDSNNEIKKVKRIIYGETGKKVSEYYYDRDKLYFVFEVNFFYSMEVNPKTGEYVINYDNPKKEENRYYFFQDEMIQWLGPDKKKLEVYSNKFEQKSADIIQESKDILLFCKKKLLK